jgi:hypothetical protein
LREAHYAAQRQIFQKSENNFCGREIDCEYLASGVKTPLLNGASNNECKIETKNNLRLRLLSVTKLVISLAGHSPALGVPKAFLRGHTSACYGA